jgi:type I restriction enzyme S subunit
VKLTPFRVVQFATVYSGGTPSTANTAFWDGGIPWITPKDLAGYEARYISSGERDISEEGLRNSSATLLPADTVILSTRAPVGYVAIAAVPLATNQGFKNLVCTPGVAVPGFVYYMLKHSTELLESHATGATFKELSGARLKTIEFQLPDCDTQTRVADILSAYDDLIENNRRRMALLEETARQLYREWFVRLRFPGHEHTRITNGVPEGWEGTSLGAVADNLDRLRVPLSVFEREARPGSYPYHGAAGVLDHIDGYIFDGRYLLVGEDGTVQTKSGTPMLQLVEGKFWVSNHAHVLSGNIISTELLYCLLSFYPIGGHVTGVAQPKLTQASLNRIPVLVPSRLLRDEFQDVVMTIFSQHYVLQAQNEGLRAARDLLLPRLMNGEIAV